MKILNRVSTALFKIEGMFAAMLAAIVTLLILLNIFSRSLGMALYWVDEMAIYAMVWMCFISTSMILKKRQSVAVTILSEYLGKTNNQRLKQFSDLMVLVFALLMLALCFKWYDPMNVIAEDFDLQSFQANTFNFIYAEKTNTLELKKFWVWLVVPIFSLSLTVHALNNLIYGLEPVNDESGGKV